METQLNTTPQLSQSERSILESLSLEPRAISQRQLARDTGMSVGFVNAVLKKLIKTGHIKVSRMNMRSVQYLLTPKGLLQKTILSYKYIVETIHTYKDFKKHFSNLMLKLEAEGVDEFYLYGQGEFAHLVDGFLKSGTNGTVKRDLPADFSSSEKIAILNASTEFVDVKKFEKNVRVVHLIDELCGKINHAGRLGVNS
ncbi:MAG: hypothetical protein COX62_03925 [Deltaproteobacteria bacterium CG_4_10_14_0_2_um_filter_43_8]|nr:MAG: hypothetical protein COX62_03925 [Deltaproteobacteria bacterium CG_4_10_14_0_2_um_filter_43_8]PJC63579.1 MAG: hypothetical protein CO021_09055 [Deltaproteobacteria bacterium CG_4_9_14_0_2_um_filter_42_21]